MIVRSIRLKNIKSYGEGSDGNGVTITFEPGANRVAGKNGHGKTTLIESLGYALFLTGPMFEENFQLETYFLRTGKKAAEIDVTFSHRGEEYRIERGLGPNSKRQTKIVQLEDGSTCAEGEKEVSGFLCRLFELPDPKRFSELFWKLIGIRQGRLTWPFDSKPSTAKDFFEPLLEVAVFRECFQSLKPAVDEFVARLHEQEKILARLEERIRERADSATMLAAKRLQFREIEQRWQVLDQSRENTAKKVSQLEAVEVSLRAAQAKRNAAQNSLALARQQREIAAQRSQESVAAAGVTEMMTEGYHAFQESEQKLKILREKQAEYHLLEKEITDLEKKKIEFEGKSNAAQSQAGIFAGQKQAKETERTLLRERIEGLRIRRSASQAEFEKQKSETNRAMGDLSDIRHFVDGLATLLTEQEIIAEKMKPVSTSRTAEDSFGLQRARLQAENANEELQSIRQQLAAANAERASLVKQLQEIQGGICPFLREQCRQFDPTKVEVDLRERSAAIEDLQKKRGIADADVLTARSQHETLRQEKENLARTSGQLEQMVIDFFSAFERLPWGKIEQALSGLQHWVPPALSISGRAIPRELLADAVTFETSHQRNIAYLKEMENWWQRTAQLVQERADTVFEEERQRNAEQQDEVNSTEHLRTIESEIDKLGVAAEAQRVIAATCQREVDSREKIITGLHDCRGAFQFLGDEILRLEKTQQQHLGDYQRYLGAKPLAEERVSREVELSGRREQELRAATELMVCEGTLAELSRGFDDAALGALRRELAAIMAEVATELANLENARRETDREEHRFREWQEACSQRDEVLGILHRLKAAVKLTEFARVVLRDSAPIVAQQLCDRIADQAQRIFNRINHDPAEVRWEAAPRYSLRVIPGDRRFAMLSGGEQTKLALAMTLAMIQEFSGLRFCIFDEPTYGVDAESREKLGDALLESQKTAELEQLILVSHDDAFDGKIEHSVFLRKTAAHGTEVVQFFGPPHGRESQNSVACEA
jgi:DNA repair protein SbcC/Rad50